MKELLNFKYLGGVKKIHPAHPMASNWEFTEVEEAEASLAQAIAVVAEKNKMSSNDLSHVFPYILRMLKSDINWSK